MLPGRIHTFRVQGSALLFIDLSQNGHLVQAVVNFGKLKSPEFDSENFKKLAHSLRRGHIFRKIHQRLIQDLELLYYYRHQRNTA